jgi:hypothetical protein
LSAIGWSPYQYFEKNLGCRFGDDTIVAKSFISRAGFFQILPVGIEAKWNAMDDQERAQTSLIQIKMDNGPESNGRRTQFLYRMVQLADKFFSGNRLRPCDTVRGQRDARTGGVRWIR